MQAEKVLHKLIQKTCPDMHKVRRDSLQANVLASLTGQRLTVTDIGRAIQSRTSPKHNIKRADRLLSNRHLLCRDAQALPYVMSSNIGFTVTPGHYH